MQTVDAAFTAEERDKVRKISHNLQVSWKKETTLGNRTFTIGVSLIGGNDIIGINPGAVGSPANYKYFDESAYVTQLAWERGLHMPTGGLTMALAEATIENTSGRFTPGYMGGDSELFTSILPRRPVIINAGFNYNGIDQVIPQFAGQVNKNPEVDIRGREVTLNMADYIDFFENRYLDHTAMFTAQRTDTVMETMLAQLGLSTSQYDLDTGINIVKFGLFETGTKYADIFHQLAEAENGHFYQDETGILRFENRQHWNNSPYDQVQKVILTGQVLNAEAPSDDHIINVVEIKGSPREVGETEMVWNNVDYAGAGVIPLLPGEDTDVWANYNDPIFDVATPTPNGTPGQTSFFGANLAEDASSTDMTGFVYLKSMNNFAQASKMVFHNNSTSLVFLVVLALYGRAARRTGDIYYREEYGGSITAYEERPLMVENDYIQDMDWARSYAGMLLEDYSRPENLQRLTIRAIPELQLGDLVSWQGRYWRVYEIKTNLDASSGFIQELSLLQRQVRNYFRIGFSSIGGTDAIAP